MRQESGASDNPARVEPFLQVMAGLVPAIHALLTAGRKKDVDAREDGVPRRVTRRGGSARACRPRHLIGPPAQTAAAPRCRARPRSRAPPVRIFYPRGPLPP